MSTSTYHAAATDAAIKRLLYEVGIHGPCNLRTLAEKTQRSYRALHHALKRLHEKGLLHRKRKSNNVIWSLTPLPDKPPVEKVRKIKVRSRDGLPKVNSVWALGGSL